MEKGKRKFVTVVSNIETASLLEVIDSHKSDEIIEVLKAQPTQMRENVKEVSVDMWGGFQKVIKEVFPNALIVIDRFHVVKLVNKALNKIRLLLDLKGLKSGCDRPVGFLRRPYGSRCAHARAPSNRYLLLKNGADLTGSERQDLQQLLNNSACLGIAYELKEELRDIYETSTTVKMGYRRLKKRCDPGRVSRPRERAPREWLVIARIIFGQTAQTLEKHIQAICHYFVNRTTSGVMEGINNKIKLIIRQSYGFKSFNLLREKLLACLF